MQKFSRLEVQNKAFSRVGPRLWNELSARMRSRPMKTFKNELHNLLLSVLEQCDDYLDTDQITFALKKSDHMKRWLWACLHTAFYCWDLEKMSKISWIILVMWAQVPWACCLDCGLELFFENHYFWLPECSESLQITAPISSLSWNHFRVLVIMGLGGHLTLNLFQCDSAS